MINEVRDERTSKLEFDLGWMISHQRTNGGVLFTNHLKVQLMLRAKRSNCYQWINVIFCCYGLLSSFGVNKQVKQWLLFLPLANGRWTLSVIPSNSFIGLKVTQLKGQNPWLKTDSSPHRFAYWRCLIMSYLWTIQISTEVGDVCSNEISVVFHHFWSTPMCLLMFTHQLGVFRVLPSTYIATAVTKIFRSPLTTLKLKPQIGPHCKMLYFKKS